MQLREVRLVSDQGFRDGAPPALCAGVLQHLDQALRGSVRMAFEGRSRASGRPRAWLPAAWDARLVDFQLGDDAILVYSAPIFGDVAEEVYCQAEFWFMLFFSEWIAFDVVANVLEDANEVR